MGMSDETEQSFPAWIFIVMVGGMIGFMLLFIGMASPESLRFFGPFLGLFGVMACVMVVFVTRSGKAKGMLGMGLFRKMQQKVKSQGNIPAEEKKPATAAEPEKTTMICPFCGSEIPKTVEKCPVCDTKVQV